ncbi:ABL038Wp [Eremothecium gossypii ATCC 10895]|uniref:Aspartate aminotransferase n=1 Tax=Eremothecium gossypii (strain ATCC 10895 / CBS 109.51 / FGSC 9923 / NRRL Y-1056) TaxID=284811 RepID=Q75DQ5_EREGS|nr:ABL038Wp [Eremothecium gossypii ATCC 10895]AAS50733.2 ABL038Wp [Eremothecium gossypii ATCC 10895]AEY95022.1 FABL038Wp [Eremothecium gossypii FDAG1]
MTQTNQVRASTKGVLGMTRNVVGAFTANWRCRRQHQALGRVPEAMPDQILGLTERFNQDRNPHKVNLTVGIYKDDNGEVTSFPSVARAQRMVEGQRGGRLAYLPIAGCPSYGARVSDFLYSECAPQGREFLASGCVSFMQTLSGTGALSLASLFLSNFISKTIWVPQPSWANHMNIFKLNGFEEVRRYRYYEDGAVDVDSWLAQLERAAADRPYPQCILLHACCHNPTGVDPTREQWSRILSVINGLGMVPIVDMAYQGLESGDLRADAYLLRMCLEHRWDNGLYVCHSFAKNMGLYGERVGSLSVVHPLGQFQAKAATDSQLKCIIRASYSSPPSYGSRVATTVLSVPEIKQQWHEDVHGMCNRLWSVRCMLHEKLRWPKLIDSTSQHGMFYYTGIGPDAVDTLREKYSVYLTKDGRLSLAGINTGNVDYVARALRNVSTYP